MAGVNARRDFQEARLPVFAFPAMRRVGVHREAFVPAANLDQHVEVVGAHGRSARMDFMGEEDPERFGLLANPGGLLDEAVLSFFEEVEVAALPEAPGIARRELPAKGHAPEHGDDLYAELSAEIKQVQDVILRPLLDFLGGLLRHIAGDERPDGWAARPGGGVDPEGAVSFRPR